MAFLGHPEVGAFFRPAEQRTILNENEFAQSDGRLFRMDRVIVDPAVVTVVDYKTGDEQEEYANQVRTYMNILHDIYPGRLVRGVLAYVDRDVVKEVIPSAA